MKRKIAIFIIIFMFILVIISASVLGLRQYFHNTPDFSLNKIEILPDGRALEHLQEAHILKAAGLDQAARPNIFDIDLLLIKTRLEKVPWIEEAEIRRFLPGRILLKIRERQGIARVKIKGRFFLIDPNCVILPDVQNILTYDVPLVDVKDIPPAEPPPGGKLDSDGLRDAVVLLDRLKTRGFLEKYPILTITPQSKNGMFLLLSETKVEVRLPRDEYDSLLIILEQLLLELKEKINKISFIDLRFKDPVIKEK